MSGTCVNFVCFLNLINEQVFVKKIYDITWLILLRVIMRIYGHNCHS